MKKTPDIENSPFGFAPIINMDHEKYSTTLKSTRKIPKMPFKVLDAPQL